MSGDQGARPANPEIDQDRAADLCECWSKYGYVMFPQQVAIYRHLTSRVAYRTVLEAGCGDGIGGAWLSVRAKSYTGTDKLAGNVAFARCLHPWLPFEVWDLNRPWHGAAAETVVCVEALEHVGDPARALRHLLDAATHEVWFSTPNGSVKQEHPPSNPYHVAELTPAEVLALVPAGLRVKALHWETFAPVGLDTDVNPLVYRVLK